MKSQLLRFREIVEKLRHPQDGCPWDLKQSHQSLKKYFIEEVYEFLHEVDQENPEGMEEELGDVLLQVYLHARLLEESSEGKIDLESVASKICEKMLRRHPHVFDPDFEPGEQSVEENWQILKALEKGESAGKSDPFEEHQGYPGLQKVERIYKDVKKTGFRFPSPRESLDKVQEELNEVYEELSSEQRSEIRLKEELGDLLLSSYSAVVEFGYSPEELLQSSLGKFQSRWKKLVHSVEKLDRDMLDMDYEEKLKLWNSVKDGR